MFLDNLPLWAVWPWVPPVANVLVILSGLFLVLLVLIQRGKGGGLAGAFGGVGGSSAFGSRAGDTFTRVTIIVAAVWILLIMFTVKIVQPPLKQKRTTTPAAAPVEKVLLVPNDRQVPEINS